MRDSHYLGGMTEISTIHAGCSVFYASLNAQLAKEGEISAPANVTIEEIALRGDSAYIYAAAKVRGPYQGGATLQFKPGFDSAAKSFTVDDVQIRLEEDNMFAKFAGKMINNMLGEKLDEQITELVNKQFHAILDGIFTQLRDLSFPGGGKLKFDTTSWEISNLRTDEQGIHFDASIIGQTSIEY